MSDLKDVLHAKLREVRGALLAGVDGASEYDLRRPMTPTGTNLLGLVKHLVGVEHVYLGESFGRPAPDVLPWVADGSVWDGADMWATADESSQEILALYHRACAHGDTTLDALSIDAPGRVPHWPPATAGTTLGYLLVRMVAETAQHAGHAEIIRELADGRTGSDTHDSGTDWPVYVARIKHAADAHR
ncbi:DinB family protein [Aeromicrobium wangtongii]|uniref:DinB family protein n=1 Tax=Aeromicrobium wangtongii TaxID=2969247 RepID=A0ABY5M2I6_9ACTN|nr:DinB family protein [Aeromicrobium wangtongii]MCD9198378.1 DinB family protein [Aeromicrobium wangtongii]UUP12409.1 DinB family protein [Aeromicrobium wangtongii]